LMEGASNTFQLTVVVWCVSEISIQIKGFS